MKLYAKIILLLLALISVAFWANIHFSRKAVAAAMSGQIGDAAEGAAAHMSEDLRAALVSGSEMKALKALQAYMQRTGAIYCGLLAPDGTVLAHTNVAITGARLNDPLFRRAMETRAMAWDRIVFNGQPILDAVIPVQPKNSSGEDLMFVGLEGNKPSPGFLRAGLPLTPARKAEGQIQYHLLLIGLAVAVIAVILGAFSAHVILRQVNLLAEGIRKVRGGHFGVTVPVVSSDELGEAARSFNKLCQDLSDTTVSRDYLDSVLESLPDPLLITDEEGWIIKSNRAASEFSGYDLSGPEKINMKDILEQHTDGAGEPFALLSWSGRISELDLWVKAKDGRRLPAMLSAVFIGSEGHRQIVSLLKDTTRHREAEARMSQYLKDLAAVNSELDAFAHTVSHDLKEPLRGIEMFSGMLLSDHSAPLDPQAADYLGRIARAAGRMRKLIDDLLSYSRISRIRNPYETASTRQLAAQAVSELAAMINEHKAEVAVSDSLPEIYCDPVKLRQVFHNLVTNAMKYNDRPAPKVTVSAEKFGEYYWKFSVADNGIGIPAQYFEEIFTMFKRLHARGEYGGGTGAGLAIVRKIIEEHNGKIWVESAEGEGSTFFFLLPEDLRRKP